MKSPFVPSAFGKVFLFFFLTVNSIVLFGIDWPLEEPQLLAGFGEKQNGNFLTGVYVTTEGDRSVYPVEEGEIVFIFKEDSAYSGLPSGLGNFIIIEHEGGLKSLYGHLKNGSIKHQIGKVSRGTVIGEMGDTGGAAGNQLYLEIIDREIGQFINPQLLLPLLPDETLPVIQEVRLERSNRVQEVMNGSTAAQGKVKLRAVLYDPISGLPYFNPTVPHQIIVYANGVEVVNIVMESIKEMDGELYLQKSEKRRFSDFIISETEYYLGDITLNSGETRLEIIIRDIAGNETSKQISLRITE